MGKDKEVLLTDRTKNCSAFPLFPSSKESSVQIAEREFSLQRIKGQGQGQKAFIVGH